MNETINNPIKNIDAKEWAQVLSLFDQLSALSADEQSQRLNSEGLSESAEDLLIKMLAAQHQPNMLDQTIDPLVEALLGEEAVNELVNPTDIIGRTFGAWKAVKTLGSGGMGQVFVAERADGQFEKQVALKVIKSGQFSALSQQRFMHEMRTLAQFEHPNIAHLIDGGTSEDGITYFVMELVSGEPIVAYANAKQLTLNERINLVLQVIDAVEYAHQSLIIHGDIKPANILVNESAQVKLVDFGIARSLDAETPDSYLPQFTPSYSAPEQAQGKVLTTASDVFGLCAVLYELCTGSSPRNHQSKTTQLEFIEQINTPITAAYTNFLLNQSQFQPPTLSKSNKDFNKALSQELGAIIDKGLQIAVVDRYKNTTELRRDLLLFVEGSAVPSYANNGMYRWRKFFTKHKWPASLYALALVLIMVTAMIAFNQARLAQQEADKANWTNDFLLSVFDQADPVKNQQNPITVNELMAVASEQLLDDDSNLVPALQINALSLLGNIQYKLGQAESAAKIHHKQIGLMEQHSSDLDSLAQAYFDLSMDYQQLGLIQEVLIYAKKTSEVIPIEKKVTHMGVIGLQTIALQYIRMNKLDEAESIINKLLSIEDDILKADKPFESIFSLYFAYARLETANEHYEQALKAIKKAQLNLVPYNPISLAEVLAAESSIYSGLHRYELAVKSSQEAVDIFKLHYGSIHPETLIILVNHASLLGQTGDFSAAIVNYLEIMAISKNLPVPDFYIPIMSQNLGHQYRKADQCENAIEYFKQAESLWSTLETRRVTGEVNTFSGLARCYLKLNQLELSASYFNQSLQVVEAEYGIDHSLYSRTQLMQVSLLLAQNKIAELNDLMPQLYQTLIDQYGADSTWVASASLEWAKLYAKQADIKNTQLMAQQALNIYQKSEPAKVYKDLIEEANGLLAENNY